MFALQPFSFLFISVNYGLIVMKLIYRPRGIVFKVFVKKINRKDVGFTNFLAISDLIYLGYIG